MNAFRRHRRTAIVILTTGVVLLATAPAGAVTITRGNTQNLDGKVLMSPAAEQVATITPDGGDKVGPGSVIQRSIILQNRSKQAVTFDLDLAQVVGSSAELVVDVRHGVREGAAGWASLEQSSITLRPGETGTLGLTIRVPKQVKPGSKAFAVTATQRGGDVSAAGGAVAPQFRQVSIFIVELPGDAEVAGRIDKLQLSSAEQRIKANREGRQVPDSARLFLGSGWFDGSNLSLDVAYRNSGERLLRPAGTIVVKDLLGREAGRYELEPMTVYPEGEATVTTELKGLPSLGVFTLELQLADGDLAAERATLPRFVVMPRWLLWLVGIAVAVTGVGLLRRWRARRRYLRAELDALDDELEGEFEDEDGSDA